MGCPCLCITVEGAAIRQGAGEWAVLVRPTEDKQVPPRSLGFALGLVGAVAARRRFSWPDGLFFNTFGCAPLGLLAGVA